MLPPGYLFENQQPILVAAVEKMRRLRIMRSADDVALEFLAENPRIAFLHACRHGLAQVWKRLMAIQPAQLQMFSIQVKAGWRKLRFAKTGASVVMIQCCRSV